jgi:hypothetical protein
MAKTKYERLPQRYKHLLTEDQYIRVLELSQDFLEKYGEVTKVEDGIIDFTPFEGPNNNRYGLDNLVRLLKDEQLDNWPHEISSHFSKFFSNVELGFDQGVFEQIKDILSIRVYPDSYFEELNMEGKLVFKVDFEDTKSTLVFDYPDKFEPVLRENLDKWNITEEFAFSIAMDRVSQYEIRLGKKEFESGFDQFSFFSSTYSAAFLLDFERNAKMCIGKFGALVNIPTHGSAFAVPIDANNVPEIISNTQETINRFFDEDPGQINTNYYWYYAKNFVKFQTSPKSDGYSNLHIPADLINLLKKARI